MFPGAGGDDSGEKGSRGLSAMSPGQRRVLRPAAGAAAAARRRGKRAGILLPGPARGAAAGEAGASASASGRLSYRPSWWPASSASSGPTAFSVFVPSPSTYLEFSSANFSLRGCANTAS